MLNVIILANNIGIEKNPHLAFHELAGQASLYHILKGIQLIKPACISIIFAHENKKRIQSIQKHFPHVNFFYQDPLQKKQFILKQILSILSNRNFQTNLTLILCGNFPLMQEKTLKSFLKKGLHGMTILTNLASDLIGQTRVIRDQHGKISQIALEKDFVKEKEIKFPQIEISSGALVAPTSQLKNLIKNIHNKPNALKNGSCILTNIISIALANRIVIKTQKLNSCWEGVGIYTRSQQIKLERSWQKEQACRLIKNGVYISDPERFDLRGNLLCGTNVFIDINCVFEGNVYLGNGTHIEPHCILKNVRVASGCRINAYSYLQESVLSKKIEIGPFSRIRPNVKLKKNVRIGSFVEVKNSIFGENTKANHLSYIGDSDIGKNVNIGAGVITCNYNGERKFRTKIKENAFIGADSQLIAPIKIGKGATIGAGTTLTRDAPDDQLTISRIEQISIKSWTRPQKKK